MRILITGSLIPILFLPTALFRYVGGVSHISFLLELRVGFWHSKPQKLSFWKTMSWKSYFHAYMDNQDSNSHSVSSDNFSLDFWEVWVKCHGYRINGLRFDPQNHKNIVFESLWIKMAIFMHSCITGSPIPILILRTSLFWCLGGVSQISWLSDLRFTFWTSKSKKLSSWKPTSWKN